jgi:hypothetical protein
MRQHRCLRVRFAGFVALLILIGSAFTSLRAAVLTNNIVIDSSWGFTLLSQVTQPAGPGGGHGSFAIYVTDVGPGQYLFSYAGIAELYSVHNASFGQEFTPAYVLTNTPLLHNLNNPGSFEISLLLGQSILLSYWDDYYDNYSGLGNSTPGIPDPYDGYGWFRLSRTPAGLIVSDSATAVGGGIVVGTYTQVPEPSVMTLFLAGFGVLARRKQVAGLG